MSLFIAFGARIGSIGRPSRMSMADRVEHANASLSSSTEGVRIVSWFGHTGNFVIESHPTAASSLQSELPRALASPCCIIPLEQLQDYIAWLDDIGTPSDPTGQLWNPGLAFLIEGQPSTVQIAQAQGLLFERLAHDVVGVWKRQDRETLNGPEAPIGGGWSEVSRILHQQLGGLWTVRSIRSVLGVLKRAVLHASKRPDA